MVEAEGVRDFLTHHVQPLVWIVIGGSVKVGVVHLGRALRDVGAAGDVDRRQAEPAIVAVCAVAHLGGPNHHRAAFAGLTGNNRGSEGSVPTVPVARRRKEMRLPIGRRQVVP